MRNSVVTITKAATARMKMDAFWSLADTTGLVGLEVDGNADSIRDMGKTLIKKFPRAY